MRFCQHRYYLNVSFQIFSFAFNISMNWKLGVGQKKIVNPYSLLIIFDPLAAKVGNDVESSPHEVTLAFSGHVILFPPLNRSGLPPAIRNE